MMKLDKSIILQLAIKNNSKKFIVYNKQLNESALLNIINNDVIVVSNCKCPKESNVHSYQNKNLTQNMIDHFVYHTNYNWKNEHSLFFNYFGITGMNGEEENSIEVIDDDKFLEIN